MAKKYKVVKGGEVSCPLGKFTLNNSTSQAKLKYLFEKGHKGVIVEEIRGKESGKTEGE